jgi:hypothetical protein
MSLYNDGYSSHAVALAIGLGFGSVNFTQNATNNLLATDTVQIGNATFTIVAAIGTTPGNVLKGANWLATMTNIINAMQASISGSGATANYIPFALASNAEGAVGTTVATFTALQPGAGLASVYTASGTSGGTFSAASFGNATAQTRAVDWTVAAGLSVQFEVTAPIENAAVFQVWSDIPSTGNPCVASGVSGNQSQMSDTDICNPLTGAAEPMTVTIPVTAVTQAMNVQGFLATTYTSPVGAFYQGRPRCLGANSFIFVKAISGDVENVNITLLLSRLKYTS